MWEVNLVTTPQNSYAICYRHYQLDDTYLLGTYMGNKSTQSLPTISQFQYVDCRVKYQHGSKQKRSSKSTVIIYLYLKLNRSWNISLRTTIDHQYEIHYTLPARHHFIYTCCLQRGWSGRRWRLPQTKASRTLEGGPIQKEEPEQLLVRNGSQLV